jgi:hypothetical protein
MIVPAGRTSKAIKTAMLMMYHHAYRHAVAVRIATKPCKAVPMANSDAARIEMWNMATANRSDDPRICSSDTPCANRATWTRYAPKSSTTASGLRIATVAIDFSFFIYESQRRGCWFGALATIPTSLLFCLFLKFCFHLPVVIGGHQDPRVFLGQRWIVLEKKAPVTLLGNNKCSG